MPDSWRSDPHTLPPPWGDNEPFLEPVNSAIRNTPLTQRRSVHPSPGAIFHPPPTDVDPNTSLNLDNPRSQGWRGPVPMDPYNANLGYGNPNSPFNSLAPLTRPRRGPNRMQNSYRSWPRHNDSSDSDSDADNRMALVPWIPPTPRSGKHLPLYTRPSSVANLPVSPRHAQKHFTINRPPSSRRSLHRPSRGAKAHLQDSLVLVASRPLEWRPDYSPRRTSGLKRGISRMRTAINSRGSCYDLNPLILYDPDAYPIYYDLRHEPEVIDIMFLNLRRESNQLDLFQLATMPPVHEMCLWHPRLPWYVHIEASQPNGITLADIFTQMYDQLHEGITSNHYYNVLLTSTDREEISIAFAQRTHGFPVLQHKGIMRIDFLRSDIICVGLSKSKDGMWKIKTKRPPE
ncbi:hypothetical protein BDZ94DRAFT_852532 [Collybia nuda]|uniref:DUF6699 domain-containing protein n=1 Tax=Collybia nuda TaxID=64659 RepID=A0A9P5YG24_9AGAR|nr:hypothetical protein BDZ94DRAFT_852532 [Collybia nuda]